MTSKNLIASVEQIESRMFLIRGQKVMLSTHLAELYEVEPRILVRAVKRNIMRAFVRLRQMLASNSKLSRKLASLEKKYDLQFNPDCPLAPNQFLPLAGGRLGWG